MGGWGGLARFFNFAGTSSEDYWRLSSRPLHSLAVLAPLMAVFLIGTAFFMHDQSRGTDLTIVAHKHMAEFFKSFGLAATLAPTLAIVVVLLVWHVVSKDRWKLRPAVLVGMVLEAALWSLPLVVFAAIVSRGIGGSALADIDTLAAAAQTAARSGASGAGGTGGLTDLPWETRTVISIGAGLYEEFLFRLVGIALLHMIVKDLLQGSENAARAVAIVGTAMAFALYHPVTVQYTPAGSLTPQTVVLWGRVIFYLAAGVYFACVYLFRGFGVAVYTHAIYDLIVLVVLGGK